MIRVKAHHLLATLLITLLSSPWASADDQATFENARHAQLQADWSSAAELYAKVTEQPWLQAAMCYRAHCLAELGDRDEAMALHRAYLNLAGEQPHRGEVLLELARLHCLEPNQSAALPDADDLLQQAAAWVQQHAAVVKLEPGPDPGNISPLFIGPRTILNAATTPWYLPRLHTRLLLLRVHVTLQMGQKQTALSILEELVKLDQDRLPSWFAPHLLAELSTQVKRGYFLLTPDAQQRLSAENGPAIKLACFHIQTGDTALARPLLTAAHAASAAGAGAVEDWAASELALAACDVRDGHPQEAIKRLRVFTGVLRSTNASRTGRLMLANMLAAKKQSLPEAYQLYADLSQDADVAADAVDSPSFVLLAHLVAAINQADSSTAYRVADRLAMRFPDSRVNQLGALVMAGHAAGPTGHAKATGARIGVVRQSTSQLRPIEHAVILPGVNGPLLEHTDHQDAWRLQVSPYPRVSRSWSGDFTVYMPLMHPQLPHGATPLYVVPFF